jgi:hypothetical protein
MSKRTREAAAAKAKKREKLVPDTFGDKVITLLHAVDDEEDQFVGAKVPDIVIGLMGVLAEIEDATNDSDETDAALHSLIRFTEAFHQELVNEEIRRLERALIRSELFQNLMVTWLRVIGVAAPQGDKRTDVAKKLHDVHFELSKRGVEVLEPVLEALGEKVHAAAKEAAKAARASEGGDEGSVGSEFDDEDAGDEEAGGSDDDDDDEEEPDDDDGSDDE